MKLRRRLTLFSAWSLAFGCVIGWGSFVMPGTTFLPKAGTLGTLIAMEISAFMMLIISYNYAYMIRKFPVSGGQFVYAERAFGKVHGFICAWFLGLSYICIIPLNATGLVLIFRAVTKGLLQFGFHYTVAGYDIYLGEILLSVSVLLVFAFIGTYSVNITGRIQSFLVVLLLSGVILLSVGGIISPESSSEKLMPLFSPEGNVLSQLLAIVVIGPFAFVGFDIVPQLSEESNFSHDRVKVIMDTSILCGCFVYISLALVGASVVPENYSGWPEYVNAIDTLKGIEAIPVFFAARKYFGDSGILIVVTAAISAMLTGVLGFYTATSRLLYSMARERMIPSYFATLNNRGAPVNAIIFCMSISLLIPFIGRNALGWGVNMSSVGGAISFGYTSLAALKFSRIEGRTDIMIFGGLGFILSMIFALLLLVPIPSLDCSLDLPSYILLVLWTILGAEFFSRSQIKNSNK